MDKFQIRISPAAARDLDQLDDKLVQKILEEIDILKENPFPKGKLIRKIKGKSSNFYRLRVGNYRVFYFLDGQAAVILKVIDKKNADRFIKNL
ncbi:MAG: type II toxin-antitoxin system RelE/ParE family toxin [bacterium]|nr:type II toxin-antitoxin system RelE/ParE family toxin [bacterium]